MKRKLLEALYDCFYTPPQFQTQRQEAAEYRKLLNAVLEKPEQNLVLRLIDSKDYTIESISIDSFISGFALAWKLSMELAHYENERPVSRHEENPGARFANQEVEEE